MDLTAKVDTIAFSNKILEEDAQKSQKIQEKCQQIEPGEIREVEQAPPFNLIAGQNKIKPISETQNDD